MRTPMSLMVLLGAAATAAAAGPPDTAGEAVYQSTCVACHGADGKGVVPGAPDFTDPGGRLSQPDAVLFRHVRDGFQAPGSLMAMPPKGGNPDLSDAQIRAVIGYLRRTFRP